MWWYMGIFISVGKLLRCSKLEHNRSTGLEDEDAEEEVRWYAARILGEFNQPSVINALVELLKTSERGINRNGSSS